MVLFYRQRSGLCPTSPRLHARKVRQKSCLYQLLFTIRQQRQGGFASSTMTALTTVSAMSRFIVIKSRGFPLAVRNPSRDRQCISLVLIFADNATVPCHGRSLCVFSLTTSNRTALKADKPACPYRYNQIPLQRTKTPYTIISGVAATSLDIYLLGSLHHKYLPSESLNVFKKSRWRPRRTTPHIRNSLRHFPTKIDKRKTAKAL